MKKMNKKTFTFTLFGVFLILLIMSLVNIKSTNAISLISLFKRTGNAVILSKPAWTLGSGANPILEGNFTTLNASTANITILTISGASAGNLDMGNYAITNASYLQGVYLNATGTAATSTFAGGLVVDGRVGIGTASPDSVFHIKANVSGLFGQIIIQSPTNSVNTNVAITAYESDGSGDPDQQLWYLGSSAGANANITFLNKQNGTLTLATNDTTRLTISATGNVGIATSTPAYPLVVNSASANQFYVDSNGGITVSGTTTLDSDLRLKDDKYLYFDTAKTISFGYDTNYGVLKLDDGTQYGYLASPRGFDFIANAGADGGGNWEPEIVINEAGQIKLSNTSQGTAGNKYLEIGMSDGVKLNTGGGYAILLADAVSSSDTFNFPNLIGDEWATFLMATGTQDILTSGNATTTGNFAAGSKLYVYSGGNIGIATSTPAYPLVVNSASANAFYIDSSGNVVINGDLTVTGNLALPGIELLVLYSTSTQSIANGSLGDVLFHGTQINQGFSFTYATASTTIPRSADYMISFNGWVDKSGGAAQTVEVVLFKDNVQVTGCDTERTINSTTETGHFGFTCSIPLILNEVIRLGAGSSLGDSQFARIGNLITAPTTVSLEIEQLD